MPIGWGVEHAARLVVATATGVVNRTDIESYLDDLVTAATLSYRKVFDMGDCRLVLSADDMRAIGERVRSHERLGPMGKVAIIAVHDEHYEQARLFEAVVVAERPLKVFRETRSAYDWLAQGLPEGLELSETRRVAAGKVPPGS
jgi:hypothetical protein